MSLKQGLGGSERQAGGALVLGASCTGSTPGGGGRREQTGLHNSNSSSKVLKITQDAAAVRPIFESTYSIVRMRFGSVSTAAAAVLGMVSWRWVALLVRLVRAGRTAGRIGHKVSIFDLSSTAPFLLERAFRELERRRSTSCRRR